MNILITGGTGFIGSHLIKRLQKDNHNITVLTRNINNALKKLGSSVSYIDELTIAVIENSDAVINLAGEPIAEKRWTPGQKQKICQSRWRITSQLTTYINSAKNPPRVLISGSAVGIYGRQNSEAIDEEYIEFSSEFTNEVCAEWEYLALKSHTSATRVAILRTGVVLDKKAGALAKMLVPFKLGLGGKLASGEQMMSWIHIADAVNAIMHILDTDSLNGPINLTAERPVSNKKFTEVLASTLCRPCLLTTPKLVLTLLFGEMADILIYGQNVSPIKLKDSGFTFSYPTIEQAFNDLLK